MTAEHKRFSKAFLLACLIWNIAHASDFDRDTPWKVYKASYAIVHSDADIGSSASCKRITPGGSYGLPICKHDHELRSFDQRRYACVVAFYTREGASISRYYSSGHNNDEKEFIEKVCNALDETCKPEAIAAEISHPKNTSSSRSSRPYEDSRKLIKAFDKLGPIADIDCQSDLVPTEALAPSIITAFRQSCSIQNPTLLTIYDRTPHQKNPDPVTTRGMDAKIHAALLVGSGYGFFRMLYDIKCFLGGAFQKKDKKYSQKSESETLKKLSAQADSPQPTMNSKIISKL